jgi:hypothetical protein
VAREINISAWDDIFGRSWLIARLKGVSAAPLPVPARVSQQLTPAWSPPSNGGEEQQGSRLRKLIFKNYLLVWPCGASLLYGFIIGILTMVLFAGTTTGRWALEQTKKNLASRANCASIGSLFFDGIIDFLSLILLLSIPPCLFCSSIPPCPQQA